MMTIIKLIKSFGVLLFAALLVLYIGGCTASNGDSVTLESAKWQAESLNGTKLVLSKSITIEFNKKALSVGGFAGCNTYFGSYAARENKLSFSELGATEMFCDNMKTESDFLNALKSVDSYKISGSKLTLYSGGAAVIVFKKSSE